MPPASDEERLVIDVRERERRLYDRVRSRMIQSDPGEGSSFRDLILLVPDLVVLLFRLVRDPRVPLGAKLIAGMGVAYVLSPIDLLPEFLFGPFGLIDDLFVLAAALSSLLNRVHPDLVRSHWSGQGDALVALQKVTDWSETQISGRVTRLLRRLTGSRPESQSG